MNGQWFLVRVSVMVLLPALFAGCEGDGGGAPPPAGSLVWAKSAVGGYSDYGASLAALSDGSVVVTGWFQAVATFGPGESNQTALISSGGEDIFVARYGPDGKLAWATGAGGTTHDYGESIAVLPDGSPVVTGEFYGRAVFGPGESCETALTAAGLDDVFVARYSPDGTLAWAKRAGGTDYDRAYGIAVLSDGSTLVTGQFRGTATFGPGEASETTLPCAGVWDIFLARFNADGTLAWAKRAGGVDSDSAADVAALTDDSSIVTGSFTGTATFGPGETSESILTSTGGTDVFVARYNADGTLAWVKHAGGTASGWSSSVAVLPDGSAFVAGGFNGLVTFGPGEANETTLPCAGINNIFLALYNADGTLRWASCAGGMGNDAANGVAALSDGSAVLTGYFDGTSVFGPTILTSAGGKDIFMARFDPDGTPLWAERAGGPDDDEGGDVVVLSDGSAAVTGHFSSTAVFGPGETNETALTCAGLNEVFVARYNP